MMLGRIGEPASLPRVPATIVAAVAKCRASDALRLGKLLFKPMRAAEIEIALREVLYFSTDVRPRLLDSGPYQI
jgi:hypothetical protein